MRRTVALLDRLDGGHPLSGTDWDDLTVTLVTTPTVLLPTRTWRAMIRRGVDELAVALGLAYAQRFEAMARLAANPTSAGAVVDVVREVVDEPGYPVFSEAISLLRFSRLPAATDLLLRLIERPANPLVLRAALVTYTAQRDGGPIRELPSLRAARLAVQALRGPYATYRAAVPPRTCCTHCPSRTPGSCWQRSVARAWTRPPSRCSGTAPHWTSRGAAH